jgi:hypothetical protein
MSQWIFVLLNDQIKRKNKNPNLLPQVNLVDNSSFTKETLGGIFPNPSLLPLACNQFHYPSSESQASVPTLLLF